MKHLHYWSFYWPLALMSVSVLLADLFRNGTIARYPDAAVELATFAIASGLFAITEAALLFVPQMTTVYCRSEAANRKCFWFIVFVCLILTLPIVVLGFMPIGRTLVQSLFDVRDPTLANIAFYLQIMTPGILLVGIRNYLTGLLVQGSHTLTVAFLNCFYLMVSLLVLMIGLALDWPSILTVGLSQLASLAIFFFFGVVIVMKIYRLPAEIQHSDLTHRELLGFFWPVAVTSLMFSMNRPVIYAFAARTPEAISMLAALRVSFDLCILFFNPLNQFCHLYVTYAGKDPVGVRNFMFLIMFAVTSLMLIIAATPASAWVFGDALGLTGQVLEMAEQAFWVLCLVPLFMTLRNYFHGLALLGRTTGRMGFASFLRLVLVFLSCWGLEAIGLMNQYTAAAVLAFGFLVETLTIIAYNFKVSNANIKTKSLETC